MPRQESRLGIQDAAPGNSDQLMRKALTWFLLLSPLFAGVLAAELEARAGGGGGYSGGGGGGGGSGGGGGGDGLGALIYLIIRLVILLWTEGGVPGKIMSVAIVAGLIWFAIWNYKRKQKAQQAAANAGRLIHSQRQQHKQSTGVNLLKRYDPNFSRVLFIDLAHLVYVKLHESRGGLARRNPDQFAVAPYLSPELRAKIKQSDVQISEVLVGALHLERTWEAGEYLNVGVRVRANVVENGKRMFLEQRLHFRRMRGATTRAPEKVLDLGCPNCGSPVEPGLDGRCPSCGSITARGELEWQVWRIETLHRSHVGPPVGASGGVEVGTDLPTMFSPDLAAQRRSLGMRDPSFNWQQFTGRLMHMFHEIQAGWSAIDESRLRPFETDTLFDAHRYWLQRYRDSGTRNVLTDVRVSRMEVAKVEHDAYFDAITTRIFASMKESTVDAQGKVIAGNPQKDRFFTEYWTLVRRSDRAHGSAREPHQCPSCGAPLDKINQHGICGYCGSKVVSGDFDWVLAIIEQDEEYVG